VRLVVQQPKAVQPGVQLSSVSSKTGVHKIFSRLHIVIFGRSLVLYFLQACADRSDGNLSRLTTIQLRFGGFCPPILQLSHPARGVQPSRPRCKLDFIQYGRQGGQRAVQLQDQLRILISVVQKVVRFANIYSFAVSTKYGEATPRFCIAGCVLCEPWFPLLLYAFGLVLCVCMCDSVFLVTREPPQVQDILCLHLFSENFSIRGVVRDSAVNDLLSWPARRLLGLRSMRGPYDGVCSDRGYEAMLP